MSTPPAPVHGDGVIAGEQGGVAAAVMAEQQQEQASSQPVLSLKRSRDEAEDDETADGDAVMGDPAAVEERPAQAPKIDTSEEHVQNEDACMAVDESAAAVVQEETETLLSAPEPQPNDGSPTAETEAPAATAPGAGGEPSPQEEEVAAPSSSTTGEESKQPSPQPPSGAETTESNADKKAGSSSSFPTTTTTATPTATTTGSSAKPPVATVAPAATTQQPSSQGVMATAPATIKTEAPRLVSGQPHYAPMPGMVQTAGNPQGGNQTRLETLGQTAVSVSAPLTTTTTTQVIMNPGMRGGATSTTVIKTEPQPLQQQPPVVVPQQHPVPQQQPPQPMQPQGAANNATKLKVEDALSYLDEVKNQFRKLPHVYNEFLDIMKEFKSANIDTPGVIQRVSELFDGHTDLIVGFNTFLPPGYKIEVPRDGLPGQILVTITEQNREGPPVEHRQLVNQGSGGYAPQMQTIGGGGLHGAPFGVHHGIPPQQAAVAPTGAGTGGGKQPQTLAGQNPAGAYGRGAAGATTNNPQQQLQGQHIPHMQPQQPPRGAGGPMMQGALPVHGSLQQQLQQPGPPGGDPAKTPLEFNHAIQYVNKIKNRFQSNQKIYKDFLEILHTYQKEQKTIQEVYQEVEKLFHDEPDLLEEFAQFLPEAGAEHLAAKAAQEQKNMYKQTGKKKGKKDVAVAYTETDMEGMHHELAFFHKVRHSLKSQAVYDNFLKCLNLYSHEIINRQELVEVVSGFLGKFPELMTFFKNFVGYKDRGADKGFDATPELDLRNCKRLDKSYRALPPAYIEKLCSGRVHLDEAIAATLNDKWVSFPPWSEDATSNFLVTKKNTHEEAIFRCEDERFELDIILEANLATIAVLESVMKSLEDMTPDQRAQYKFNKKTLGGSSEMIHYKALWRLYDTRTDEVLAALERDPYANIPVVLKRLKLKHNEWRTTQRQWNHIWRELNEKHYLRSLDHKGQQFKRSDPLALKPKNLREKIILQREEYRAWRRAKIDAGEDPDTATGGPGAPISTFQYTDTGILDDINRLVLSATKKLNTPTDMGRMKAVLLAFIPEFLHLQKAEGISMDGFLDGLPHHDVAVNGSPATETTKEKQVSEAEDEKAATNGDVTGDKMDAADEAGINAETTEEPKVAEDKIATDDSNMDVDLPSSSSKVVEEAEEGPNTDDYDTDKDRNEHLFISNRHWFVLFKLHQILYERLSLIKSLSEKQAEAYKIERSKKEANGTGDTPPVAVSLALKVPLDIPMDDYYDSFLKMAENFVEGNLEATSFEETSREMFNTHAYKVFTIDKLLIHLAKKLSQLVTDDASRQLFGLYLQSQNKDSVKFDYRRKAFAMLADQNGQVSSNERPVFYIRQPAVREVEIELVDLELPKFPRVKSLQEEWVEYVEKYQALEPTDPTLEEAARQHPVFLKRTIGFQGDVDAAMEGVEHSNKLNCIICESNYQLYQEGEEVFVRRKNGEPEGEGTRVVKYKNFLKDWTDRHLTSADHSKCKAWMEGPEQIPVVAAQEKKEQEADAANKQETSQKDVEEAAPEVEENASATELAVDGATDDGAAMDVDSKAD